MNSAKKTIRTKGEPLFRVDPETGKFILLPRNLPIPAATNSAIKNKSSDKKSKGKISIAPLKLTAADFNDSPGRATKIRKTDNTVRKELFSIPSKKSGDTRFSINSRQSTNRRSIHTRRTQTKKNIPCELSPLLDMEEVEDELINKRGFLGYPFKTPTKPAIKFTQTVKSSSLKAKVKSEKKNTPKIVNIDATPESLGSTDNEFLELEQMCCGDDPEKENNYNQSPISSVCNLLQGTNLNSIKKQTNSVRNQQKIINTVENILAKNKIALEQYKSSHTENLKRIAEMLEADKKEYDNFVSLQEENTNKISEILKELTYPCTPVSKEPEAPLQSRKSKRLFNKSPIQAEISKIVVSPVCTRSVDLRKSMLTKNLVTKSHQYQLQSPRLQKALDMYNSMRNEISVLTTPRLDRQGLLDSPKTSNITRSLSRRIQNQCHLLQDTPMSKKEL